MPWPKECKRFVDFSWYQNFGWPLYKPFDVDQFCEDHPEVDGAVLRFVWPSGAVDKHYAHYYDGFTRNNKIVLGYGWPNPTKNVSSVIADWKQALGDRVPPAMFGDWEEASTFQGKNASQITAHMRALAPAKELAWPDVVHGEYSRAGWLDGHIIVGDWFHDLLWWLAHWIYPPPDFKNQAESFAELDQMLPIGNNFTPYRGRVVKIEEENVAGWQASSRMDILPSKGRSDGGYFTDAFLASLPGGTQPPPPQEKGVVTVQYNPIETELKIEEVH